MGTHPSTDYTVFSLASRTVAQRTVVLSSTVCRQVRIVTAFTADLLRAGFCLRSWGLASRVTKNDLFVRVDSILNEQEAVRLDVITTWTSIVYPTTERSKLGRLTSTRSNQTASYHLLKVGLPREAVAVTVAVLGACLSLPVALPTLVARKGSRVLGTSQAVTVSGSTETAGIEGPEISMLSWWCTVQTRVDT